MVAVIVLAYVVVWLLLLMLLLVVVAVGNLVGDTVVVMAVTAAFVVVVVVMVVIVVVVVEVLEVVVLMVVVVVVVLVVVVRVKLLFICSTENVNIIRVYLLSGPATQQTAPCRRVEAPRLQMHLDPRCLFSGRRRCLNFSRRVASYHYYIRLDEVM